MYSHTHTHILQVTTEQIRMDLTDPSIMPTPDHFDKLVTIATDPYEALHNAHAMVICTEWDEFTKPAYIDAVCSEISNSIKFSCYPNSN